MLLTYLLVFERGFKIALLARDSFSKLLATGLTAVFALQVFVIVGGVTKVIPLTGVTLPVHLLRRLVDPGELRAARAAAAGLRPRPAACMNAPIIRLFGLVVVLFAVLVVFTSRWAVFEAKALRDNALNKRGLLEAAKVKRGAIRAGDGTVLARSVKRQGGSTSAPIRRASCSRTPSATRSPTSARPASSASTTTS